MTTEESRAAGNRSASRKRLAADEASLVHLVEGERDCLRRYLSFLAERLEENLIEVWLCGSAARGDMWPDWMPMHSDIDLLVISKEPVLPEIQTELINETYPLFLECGRQISPQFRTMGQFRSPTDELTLRFVAQVRAEGFVIYGAAQPNSGQLGGERDGMDS
jgi:predicted nucleotidyltransferase